MPRASQRRTMDRFNRNWLRSLGSWSLGVALAIGAPALAGTEADDRLNREQRSEASDVEIAQLIEKLSADDFNTREMAMKSLWRIGLKAEPQLQLAAKSKDKEVAQRAENVLRKFRLRLFSDTPAEVIRASNEYQQANRTMRAQLFNQQIETLNVEMLVRMLEIEEDRATRSQNIARLVTQIDTIGAKLFDEGRREEFDTLSEELGRNAFVFANRANLLKAMGGTELADEIVRLEKVAAETKDDIHYEKLIWLYWANQRPKDAVQACLRIEDFGRRIELLPYVAYAAGDYQGLEAALLEDRKNPGKANAGGVETLLDERFLLALVSRFTGTPEAVAVRDELLAEWKEETYIATSEEVSLAFILDQPKLGTEMVSRFDNPTSFILMVNQDQFREAFENLGLETREKRKKWMERVYTKLGANNFQDQDPFLAVELISWLMSLGETEEATEYVEGFLSRNERATNSLRIILPGLLGHIDRTAPQALLRKIILDGTNDQLMSPVFSEFSQDSQEMVFWWEALKTTIPDRADRFFAVHGVSLDSSPYRPTREKFEEWCRVVRTQDGAPKRGLGFPNLGEDLDLQLGKASKRLGFNDLARTNLIAATNRSVNNSIEAAGLLGDLYRSESNYAEAVTWYRQAISQTTKSNLESYIPNSIKAAFCLEKLNKKEESELIRQDIRFVANCKSGLRFAAETYEELKMFEEGGEAYRLAQLIPLEFVFEDRDTGPSFGEFYNLSYHNYVCRKEYDPLGASFAVECCTLPVISGELPMIRRFSSRNLAHLLLVLPELAHQSRALDAIKRQDIDSASREMELAMNLHPGNVDNVLDFLEPLEKAGQVAALQPLIDRTRKHHEDLLGQYPNCAMVHNNYAWLLSRLGTDIEVAMEHSKKAVELRPDDHNYLDTLAECYFRAGKIDEAIALEKRCLQIYPTYVHYREQIERFEKSRKP